MAVSRCRSESVADVPAPAYYDSHTEATVMATDEKCERKAKRKRLATMLSDDLWIIILAYIARDHFRNLLTVEGVSRRFSSLANVNVCWFSAYVSAYPRLTRSLRYRTQDGAPPPNYQHKLRVSHLAMKRWTAYGAALSAGAITTSAALPSSPSFTSSSASTHLCFNHPSSPTASRHPSYPASRLSNTQRRWSHPLSATHITTALSLLHSNPDARFAYASIVPSPSLDFPSTPPLLGISVLHRVTPLLGYDKEHQGHELRTSVLFLDVPSMMLRHASAFETAGRERNWNWMVLRAFDAERGWICMAEEDDRAGRWASLTFTIGKMEGIGEKDRVCHGRSFGIPDDLIGYSVVGFPSGVSRMPSADGPHGAVGDATSLVVLVAASAEEHAVLLFLDISAPGAVRCVSRMSYGDGVTTVELGGPQERGVLWTGHKDHGVGCWDLVTGAHLMTLSGGVVGTLGGPNAEEMIRPTLGGCWVEEPECWARAFGMKAAGGDMWRKGGSLAMVTFADWGGEDVDEYSAAVGGYGFVEYGNGAAVDVVDESDDEQEPENIVTFGGGDGDGYAGEFVVWDFDAARRLARSHSISAGWRRRTRVRPIARLRLKPLLPNDEVAAFTAAHPMLMVLTTSGTFDCVNLETGATVARVFGLGAAPEKGAKEVGSGSRGDGGGNGDTGAASACGMDVNGYGFIEDQDDDERLTSACSSVTSQPLDDGGGDVAVGAQSAFGIHGIVKAPSGGGVWVLLGSGIVKLRV